MRLSQKIRAARAALGWTRAQLAERADIHEATITRIEDDGSDGTPNDRTLRKVYYAFEREGITITDTGIIETPKMYRFSGEGWFAELLHDVLKSGETELIIDNADNRKSPKNIIDILMALRVSAVNIRMMVEEGNTYLTLPVACYRWKPKKLFKNWVTVIYGDRVAIKTGGGHVGCTVFHDKDLAQSMKNNFDLLWDLLQPLTVESTADVHIP